MLIALVTSRHVLCIQDSSEINLESHRVRLKPGSGIGLIGNNKDILCLKKLNKEYEGRTEKQKNKNRLV